ncbi:MAG: Ig-like domain repeat protein, partial [Bradyrhizobium sp.]|nr:Ig-like domain repeat protein [Bradyrhizobium sp.]
MAEYGLSAFAVLAICASATSFAATLDTASAPTCPSGTVATGDACVPAGRINTSRSNLLTPMLRMAQSSCSPGYEFCAGSCVITDTDRNNCGACGYICPVNRACSSGSCIAMTGTFTPVVTSSVNPAAFGQGVTFTATINAPGANGNIVTPGTVTFMDGATALGNGTVGPNGDTTTWTYTTSALGLGGHIIKAVYSGDGQYGAATSSAITQTINSAATTTRISSAASPSTYGRSVTITVTVATTTGGVPTGTVTLSDGASQIGSGTLSGGTWTFTTSSLSAGTHSLTAA